MAGVLHLSMRVPWRDRPWDEFVCDDPLGNSSCTLLTAIGKHRDDAFEEANSGARFDGLDQNWLPCLSERATFMSRLGYSLAKKHPYRNNPAMRGKIHDTVVALPGYAFEAVPFRWLNRKSFGQEVGHDRVPQFNPLAEDAADRALNYAPPWVMDGDNQRAIMSAFFEPVAPGDSLVFVYLKHSPFQEQRTDRLLVGAARVVGIKPPPMWNQSGGPPFSSTMWETIVEHSLRPDMTDGFLLPYQQIIALMDAGVDIEKALAWAPEGRVTEFSYVTEHLSDDAAIEALNSLQSAAEGMLALGVDVPTAGREWLQDQIERLWQLRGPVPGLPGVLKLIGVRQPYAGARAVLAETDDNVDPWNLLEAIFADPSGAPAPIRPHIGAAQARIWKKIPARHQAVLRLLSGFDITADQVEMLVSGNTEVEMKAEELLDNPYFAATCTYGKLDHVPFATVDRALFPPTHVSWAPSLPDAVKLEGHIDRRRIEALLTDVLEQQGRQGDTLVPEADAIALANDAPLAQPPNLTKTILAGLDLDYDGINEWGDWSPLANAALADGAPAYKLTRFAETSVVIRDWIGAQESRAPLGAITDARQALDYALDDNNDVAQNTDELEDRARSEKAAGLSALHDAPLSVLIGPAGTGKTTLLRALVEYPGVAEGGVLLLAPTGKARVQLESKVKRPAKTLASYLSTTHRYETETGRYVVCDAQPHRNYALVVIDEASMLTEEMLAATLDSLGTVQRLILVGDPRQLPPIGAGRPFVDLVNKLRPDAFSHWIRVAPGYVELQVPRRQLPDGTQGERHDLELAAWFGDNTRGAGDEAIWADLAANPDLPTVRYVPWGDRTPVQALTDELSNTLGLTSDHDAARSFAVTYGGTVNGRYLNWEVGAGARAEEWQILSPTRSRAFGSVELNRHIKRTFRADDTSWAQRDTRRGNIPKPIGPELIVRGDKVMQTTNKHLDAWPKQGAMNYVANGEIGVALGRVTPADKTPKEQLRLNVEFSSQRGFQYSYRPTSSDDPLLELAWAVTVHKSQGTEFGITFLVLPARANVSRELMYTALTRQRDKVVILHEGTLDDLRDLAQPWRSETARRLTDLFVAPHPVTLEIRGKAQRFDRRHMHVSVSGIPMASKNEVIISALLDQLAPGQWQYEQPFVGADGRVVKPDFTISADDGRTIYWEHAGMLDLPDYARKWELKKTWYADNGVLPHDQRGGPSGTLMWTDDLKGANAQAWLAFAAEVLGAAPTEPPGPGASSPGPIRRVAKKAARRPPNG